MVRWLFPDFGLAQGLLTKTACRAILLAVCGTGLAQSPAPQTPSPQTFPVAPALGQYADTLYKICGQHKVDEHPARIPTIGCFAVFSGRTLDGDVDGRKVTIRVTPQGDEIFQVDGVEVRKTSSSDTNDPRVKVSSSGFAFCAKDPHDCPVLIDTITRQPGSFTVFDVSREFKPHTFVSNQENWDAVKAQPR